MLTLDLSSKTVDWQLTNHQQISLENVTVPGQVQTALLAQGLIADPYYGYNDTK